MRAVVITRQGAPEVLSVQERPAPRPPAGEVRIEVRAAGVNFSDLLARVGLYPDAPKLPAVVGYEVAGTIAELGPGAEGVAVGDRVLAGTRFGGYAEQVVVPIGDLAALPERLSFAEGAAIPLNYATAWAMLVQKANVRPGQRVLVHGAAGGVGIAATQIAKHLGAEVYGTASTSKQARLRELGVDVPLDYTQRGWERRVPGLDVVLDPLGGSSFRRSYRLLRPGGTLVCFGVSAAMSGETRSVAAAVRALATTPLFHPLKLMGDSKTVAGLNLLTLWDAVGTLGPWLPPVSALVDEGVVAPIVAAEVPFDRAAEAHRMLGERRNVGKVVLVP